MKASDYHRKDCQGNNAALVDGTGAMLDTIAYYPYGQPIVFPTTSSQTSAAGRQLASAGYLYGGKRYMQEGGISAHDFGPRLLPSAIPAWTRQDRLAEKYHGFSPYTYCLGDPVNFVDVDGRMVIFINGYIGFGSPESGAPYWTTYHNGFIKGAIDFFEDKNLCFPELDYKFYSSARRREEAGYQYAKDHYEAWKKRMSPNETFNLISHSMGAAFSIGIEKYIIEVGGIVNFNIMINAYQVDNISKVGNNNTIHIDYMTIDDPVLNYVDLNWGKNHLENAEIVIRIKNQLKDLRNRHREPIDESENFWNNIVNFLKDYDK